MAVKIRLKRMGKIRAPYYRIVVADSRTKRDGRVIEQIGKYHPKEEPSLIEVASDRAQYWLGVGAQPTEAVTAILKVTGDWQRFKGEAGVEGTLRVAEPRRSRQDVFNDILKESGAASGTEAVTRKAAAKKAATEKTRETRPAADQTPAAETPSEATDAASSGATDTAPSGATDTAPSGATDTAEPATATATAEPPAAPAGSEA